MSESEKVERRKELRRVQRSKVRQVLLIAEYIQHKYHDIYAEAAQFYNQLNQKHATKYDLRKTPEFRRWKMQVTGQAKTTRKRPKPSHRNIETLALVHPHFVTNEDQTLSPDPGEQAETPHEDQTLSPDPGEQAETPHEDQTLSPDPGEQAETPHEDQALSPDPGEQAETPHEDQALSPDPSEQAETPHEDQALSPDPSEQAETPHEGQALSPDPGEQAETPHEDQALSPDPGEQAETPHEDQASNSPQLRVGKHVYTDSMQLRIPLLTPPTNHPAVIVETLETITEETLQEGTVLEPSLYEELPPEVIDKIIRELQAEPGLQDIMASIEQQLEFEQLGMDIDIDEDDLLACELENW